MEQALQKDARAGRFRAALEVIQRAPMRAKLSFVVMGLGQLCYGQIVKGLLYLISFLGLLWYFIARGFQDIAGFFTLGTQQENLWLGIVGDNSMQMLILGLFAIFILIFFLVLHISNVRDVLYTARRVAAGHRPHTFRESLATMADDKFHVTALVLPVIGVSIFTILPIVFMILMAFTDFGGDIVHPRLASWGRSLPGRRSLASAPSGIRSDAS